MKRVTSKQQEIVDFINNYLNEKMQIPTLKEIASYFQVTPVAIHYHLHALEKKGIITINNNISRGIILNTIDRDRRENISIPLFEREPAFEEIDIPQKNHWYIPRDLKLTNTFAFIVTSLSMKEVGILPGDIAIMERQIEPKTGDIVLASIPDSNNNAELRKLIKTPQFVVLQSENESMGNITSTNINVYGILKALRRNYN